MSSWNANRCPHRQTHPRGRAGFPITSEYGDTSLVTIAPAPTVENSPMFRPASMIAPAPNEAPLLTVVGNNHLRSVYLVLASANRGRSEEHTSELQSRPHLVCRLLLA